MNNQNQTELSSNTVGTEYIVEENNNLYNIANRFNTTVDIIKKMNNLTTDKLSPGQILILDDMYMPNKKIYKEYFVKEDDNIYSIANDFNMTVEELQRLNFLGDDEFVYAGQELIVNNIDIPNKNIIKYKTKAGDSLYSIAKKFNTTVDNIKKLNNIQKNKLEIGQELNVLDISTLKDITTYIVLPNDTLSSIALKTGVKESDLKNANKLVSNKLEIGQILTIPNN